MNIRQIRSNARATHLGTEGFTVLEVVAAIVFLAVVALALQATAVSAVRGVQHARERTEQSRVLQAAVDWARTNPCAALDLATESASVPFLRGTVEFRTEASVIQLGGHVHAVSVQVAAGRHASAVVHTVLLGSRECE